MTLNAQCADGVAWATVRAGERITDLGVTT